MYEVKDVTVGSYKNLPGHWIGKPENWTGIRRFAGKNPATNMGL
jgi:hypothetical protein